MSAEDTTDVLIAEKVTPFEHKIFDGKDPEEIPLPDKHGYQKHEEEVKRIEDALQAAEQIEYEKVKATDVPQKFGMSYQDIEQKFEGKELIIAAGGDGNLLSTSHYVEDTEVLPFNTDFNIEPGEGSRGALIDFKSEEAEETIQKYLEGDLDLESWTRVEVEYEGETQKALNEVFYGAELNKDGSSYSLKKGLKQESHNGSGIVIATGAGSSGFYSSIRSEDDAFFPRSKQVKSAARELDKFFGDYQMENLTIRPGENLEVTAENNKNAGFAVDGKDGRSYQPLEKGESFKIRLADQPLNIYVKWVH